MSEYSARFRPTATGSGSLLLESAKEINGGGILALLIVTGLAICFSLVFVSDYVDAKTAARQQEASKIIQDSFAKARLPHEKHRLNVALPHVQACIDNQLKMLKGKQSYLVVGTGAKIATRCMSTFVAAQ